MPIQILPPDEAAKKAKERVAEWKRQKEIDAAKERIGAKARAETVKEKIVPVQDSVEAKKAVAPVRKAKGKVEKQSNPRKKKVTNKTYESKPRGLDYRLLQAVKRGEKEKIKKLIERGADVNTQENLEPILFRTIKLNEIEISKLLIENGADVNSKSITDTTVLMLAARIGQIEIVKLLIEKGANVNAEEKGNSTALMEAAGSISDKSFEISEILIKNGADVNAKDIVGVTPMTSAVKQGNFKTAELLKKHGATE